MVAFIHRTQNPWRALEEALRSWELASAYRPELHYMRGPGPKWREKHGQPGSDLPHLVPHSRPRWGYALLAAWIFAAVASFAYPVSPAPVQSARSSGGEVKDTAVSRPCEARHPAKGANAPFGPQCPERRSD